MKILRMILSLVAAIVSSLVLSYFDSWPFVETHWYDFAVQLWSLLALAVSLTAIFVEVICWGNK